MATANVLTALMPSFYAGLYQVQQEQTDLIDACNMNSALEQAVIGQTITFPIAVPATLVTTSQSGLPDFNGQTPGTGTLSIQKSKSAGIIYNGEEIRQLQLGGIYSNYYADQMAQAVRALRKAVAVDIATAGYQGACRAVGAAGTVPFGTAEVLTDFAACNKVLNDNGAPDGEKVRHLILNSNSVYNIQGIQTTLFRANEAGTDKLLRTGSIGMVSGLAVGLDVSLNSIVSTSMTSSDLPIVTAAQAVGDTAIKLTVDPCASPMAHTPVAGDRFYFGSDTANVYVVVSYNASTTTITIANPGLMATVSINTVVHFITSALYRPNLFFTRDAITLIARQPLLAYSGPQGQLLDLHTIPDPRCGLIYQVAVWQNGRQIQIEICLCWGVGVTNSQDLGILQG